MASGVGTRAKHQGHLADRFVCRPGEIKAWKDFEDVEVVVLHYWTDDRLPIASFDPATNTARFSRVPTHPFSDDWANPFARYYVENILEALVCVHRL